MLSAITGTSVRLGRNAQLLPDEGNKAHAEIHKALEAARARYKDEIANARISVLTVEGKSLVADLADLKDKGKLVSSTNDHEKGRGFPAINLVPVRRRQDLRGKVVRRYRAVEERFLN
jgi:hypothetical protein